MKTESYFRNGELHKRQLEVIPKDKKPFWIEELKCWFLLDKNLNDSEFNQLKSKYIERYWQDFEHSYFKC